MDTQHPADPENPVDSSPRQVTHVLDEMGLDAPFTVQPGALIKCESCGTVRPASEHSADRATRLEGASDPTDMTMIVAVECPVCGATGTLTLGYGPDANEDESDALAAMPRDARAGLK